MTRGGYVRVRVTAGARRERLTESAPGVFDIAVKEEAEGNRANARVRALVAQHYNVEVKRVRIEAGQHSPKKRLCIL